MSGTPSISEVYAVVGHRATPLRLDLKISLVVLARGAWFFRPSILAEFHDCGFSEILCVESGPPRYDFESVLRALPGLRILISQRPSTPGTLINQAAREIRGERFLVVWDDQTLGEATFFSRFQQYWQDSEAVVLVPLRRDPQGRELPSVIVPGLDGERLKILALGTDEESVDTLFPPDYTGLYHRLRFLQTGGFDPDISSPFWQKADWGLRSHLWGESLVVASSFRVDYRVNLLPEDQSVDASYPRFYLRNLAIRHVGDHGVLPWRRFWSHAARSGLSWSLALVDFVRQRAWVRLHRYRFRSDARLIAELWGQS